MGVSVDSIVTDEAQLRARVSQIINRYHQPALVERFIEGREVTVGLVGNCCSCDDGRAKPIHLFPVMEVDMARYPVEEGGIYSNRLKVELADDFHIHCPAPLRSEQVAELQYLTARVFSVIGCHDVARVDFRLDALDQERPYILEINPLPGLNPGYSDLCLEAEADGWSYEQLINRILDEAALRFGLVDL
jgi:D-alanine-D-alanine ligase